MNVVLFGASGNIGRAIAAELVDRDHTVTAVSRRGGPSPPAFNVVRGDASVPEQVTRLTAGYDAVISATGPGGERDDRGDGGDGDDGGGRGDRLAGQVIVARSLVEGIRGAGLKRLLVVGGAGSLEVAPGVALYESAGFPDTLKALAGGAAEALAFYRSVDDLDWTYLSPAALIEPGERTGVFRVGTDRLLVDGSGVSRISIEDFSMALVDELEQARAIRQRITVAY